jgi:hypothetical protein
MGMHNFLRLMQRIDENAFEKAMIGMGYGSPQQQFTAEETLAIQKAGGLTGSAMRRLSQVLKYIYGSVKSPFAGERERNKVQPKRVNALKHNTCTYRILKPSPSDDFSETTISYWTKDLVVKEVTDHR